ncbi:MAG: hypothetical protein SOZ23_02150 [Methanosphaera sp.]|uniref:hypothetical protein n=1 Tax=Methanosphaera sp. TaxID=2666342 RepID=UPI0025EF0DB8|nr:hypothetical protein [Methanosphaera sp.]MCI5867179.1 hypothetical protein [Methanosphaera sp.]MDD6534753.1 hypothetical protein [Methanosphaera sp.]MDY3955579.1 hypothetical protein [Methanosphaera sp.]
MDQEQKKILVKTVEQTMPWERIPTSVEGVFLVKTPEQKNYQTVFVELNPSVNGQPLKKRGVYLKNLNEYEAFIELIGNPKIAELLKVVSEFYGKNKATKIEI